MFRLQTRPAHYLVLAAAHLLLTLPNLGAHTLWDMDEGVNAEAAREMIEFGNYITPYYNYQIRTAKPAMQYYLTVPFYRAFGVNEFAARLPAVLCGLGSVLLTYELGRRLFAPTTGLIAGLALASCFEFCLISHAATPDPSLLLFTTLAFFLYWIGSEGDRRWWFVPVGIATGLATLTKGPIGVGLPGLVIGLHLLWTRRLDKLWDRRLLLGGLAFVLTAGPWYGLVAHDSRGKWISGFFLNDNLKRFGTPADGHRGWPTYHVVALIVLFAPWSVFLAATVINGVRGARRLAPDASQYRFLWCWVLTFLVFFSIAATKLPNYVLPLYPALAILTARTVDRWRTGEIALPKWVIPATVGALAFVGLAFGLGLLYVADLLPIEVKGMRPLPALGDYAALGLIPIAAAVAFGWFARRGDRDSAVAACAIGSVVFLALIAAFPTVAMNRYKCAEPLVREARLHQPTRDIRIGAFRWLRHSVVFYARREVTKLEQVKELTEFLEVPRPGYVLMTEPTWNEVKAQVKVPVRELARHYDFYQRCDVLVLGNEWAD
ncbi:MAG TPA: glycosyltransferase family 39 protein [Gemmataceae bacterium]|nr:glycosyltransferase family 39 protein [Gemmataceae bacterium]